MEWDEVRYFLAVARSRSLVAAARSLKVSAATVRRIAIHFSQLRTFARTICPACHDRDFTAINPFILIIGSRELDLTSRN